MLKKNLGVFVLAVALSGNAIGENTLVYCSEGSPEGFDPALHTSNTTFDASSRQIYNKLVEFRSGSTDIVPALAEHYIVSDDGLSYTFKLRSGVKFHSTDYFKPTRDLNANDVVFSFERQRLADNPYNSVSGGTWEYFDGISMPDLIESVDAIDDLSVKFTLTRAESPIIANLALDFASIVSEEYAASLLIDEKPELLDQQPIGTGPFKFVEYKQDELIRYQAHEGYWAGEAAIQNLVFSITPASADRYKKLSDGECQVMPYPSIADLQAIESDESIRLMEQVGLNVGYLAYNTTVAPFDNANVRKALNMAINKQMIIDSVFLGAGRIAKNPIPPTMWSYNNDIVDDPYDPERSKKILEAEGVSNLTMEIWPMPVQSPFNPNALQMAELIQKDFATVGVQVEIVSHEWGEFLKLSRELDRPGAVLFGWSGDNGDPDNFMDILLSCDTVGNSNRAQWCDTSFDNLIEQAKIETDQAKRATLYEQAQVIFKEQAPWATLAHSLIYKPVRKEVEGFTIDAFGGQSFYGVSLTE